MACLYLVWLGVDSLLPLLLLLRRFSRAQLCATV